MVKILLELLFGSKISDGSRDLTAEKIAIISFFCFFVIIVFICLALLVPVSLFYRFLILAPVLCLPFLLISWFKRYYAVATEKKEKDELLQRIERKKVNYFENIIQYSTDIIFTVDRELFILKFNKGAESQFEYSQEEIVGKPLHVLFDVKKVSSLIRRLNESGSLVNEEISMKTKAGKIRQLILNISAMNYDNPKLNGFVITAKDITEKKKLEKELRKKNEQLGLLAITDSLTDLYNVRHFYSQIKRELKRYHRNPDGQLSLILIDIDFFKALNDAKGHQMGDKVLHSLAQVINACIRQDVDSGFRYGGDEFVVLLPDTKKKQAGVVANRIQKQYRALKFGRTDLSIGITEAEVGDNEETIVKRADDAMYSSKREGGGTISTT
jgi:diguanylate cyclase (GGDEF)-like protein/PAS domain S-box-containing protein